MQLLMYSTDVGRSCIIVSLGGKNIMLDCGMHMGYNDQVCGIATLLKLSYITTLIHHTALSSMYV